MLRATFTVAKRVPKEGATSESKVGVVKLRANRKLYSARSRDWKTKNSTLELAGGSPRHSIVDCRAQVQGWLWKPKHLF